MTNPSLISEAIIISLGLLPGKVTLKDLIVDLSNHESDKIFMITLNDFYRKSFMIKEGGNLVLTCKNSLFILDMMNKVVPASLVEKHSKIDIKYLV